MTDIDASAQQFLDQLRGNSKVLKDEVAAARRERDDAQARLDEAEAKLSHSMVAVRSLLGYTGQRPEADEDNLADDEETDSFSLEGAILRVLRESRSGALTPSEIAQEVQARGATRSASSVRARLSRLVKAGILERDEGSRYSIRLAAGTGAAPA